MSIDDTTNCPLAEVCANDDTHLSDLQIATVRTLIGVYCLTLCGDCLAELRVDEPGRGWRGAAELVGQHCGHLGIDLDQMAAALRRDSDAGHLAVAP